jgi:two-component system, LytTR family, response regulator
VIRVLLVDDEPVANAGLRALLAPQPDIEVVGEAHAGKEAIRLIGALRPDLIFLDVQMPRVDGFEVLRAIAGDTMPAVIFVTAYDEFAVRAFEVRALDYLVKPVATERLHAALDRAREALTLAQNGQLAVRLRSLLDATPTTSAYASRLVVRVGTRDVFLETADVDWIQADDYCSVVHIRGARHTIRETLSSLAARLDPAIFARVHRSAIVNLTRVREVRRHGLGSLSAVLNDGTTIAVSRSRKAQLTARLRRDTTA